MPKAIIILENGHAQIGESLGAPGETIGEAVFNTSMTGYQEILTDPSYAGQVICMTYPLIGNYGINDQDIESDKIHAQGFIIKENSRLDSNFTSKENLDNYLKKNKIVGISNVDTRAIVRVLRDNGAMPCIISTKNFDIKSLKQKLKKAPKISEQNFVEKVSIKNVSEWKPKPAKSYQLPATKTIVVIDCGVKYSILNNLKKYFKKALLAPFDASAEDILALKPSAILFSNGPGDPRSLDDTVNTAKILIEKLKNKEIKIPILGICLGNQILSLALGGEIYKLKFGHHGGNHPVKDLQTGRISITAQNHNYCLDEKSISKDIEITHINLYDNTVEGLRHKKLPIYSVQYHPEAGPGPNDSLGVFEEFAGLE